MTYRLSERMKKILLFLLIRGDRPIHGDLIIKFVEGCIFRDLCPREYGRECFYATQRGCPCETVFVEKTRRYAGRRIFIKRQVKISYHRTFKQMKSLGLISAIIEPEGEFPRQPGFFRLTEYGMKKARKMKREVKRFIKDYRRFLVELYYSEELFRARQTKNMRDVGKTPV